MNFLKHSARWVGRLVCLGALSLVGFGATACDQQRGSVEVTYTVGDVISIHDEVKASGKSVQGSARLSVGDEIVTGPAGRARVRLDSGATVAVDEKTKLRLEEGKLVIDSGRAFVRAGATPLLVAWGKSEAKVSAASVAFDLSKPGAFRAYCAEGELSLTAAGKQHRVEGGETASLEGGEVRVLPEKAFEDWTGGLAEPIASKIEGKSAIPHVRARSSRGEAGSPLIVRAHRVDTKIVGEVAVTKSRTTYFNGSDSSGEAHVRLALPDGALLTKVAVRSGKDGSDEYASVQIAAGPSRRFGYDAYGLEWAGGGWLQGTVARIAGGEILELSLEYAEWLPVRSGKSTYRYATETDSAQAPVGDLALRVDAQETNTPELSASAGSEVKRRQVTYRAADVRPSGDFVVELSPSVVKEDEARIYVKRSGAQKKDAYIAVRAELPERKMDGVALAVVIDTSQSMGGALETSLAVVDALVQSLGPKDSFLVLAADESTRPIGASEPTLVTPEYKKKLQKELSVVRAGGASNLARALQEAADALDRGGKNGARDGMVLYVGDGRPSVGEPDAQSIRNLLAARPHGLPRMGAVAVGPSADRWLLSRLVSSSGIVELVSDRQDAARAGAAILAEALTPRFREVELDLGPHVDRLYPRGGQVITAGTTVEVVGRLRGPVPTKVGLSYRSGSELVEKTLSATRLSVPPSGNLAQKWAAARVGQIARDGEGIEPAIALAFEYGLLTPWTSWLFSGAPPEQATQPFAARILELNPSDTPYAGHVTPPLTGGSSLIEPDAPQGRTGSLVDAAQAAMTRLIVQSARSVRACRDARAAVNPEVGSSFRIEVSVDGNGVTTKVVVRSTSSARRDQALERCIEGVVKSLPYIGIGQSVSVSHELSIYGGRSLRPTKCSEASKVSLPVRREIWRAQSPSDADDYRAASERCELRRWKEKEALLLLMMENVTSGEQRLELSDRLYLTGEGDAADFVRDQTLRSVSSFDELQALIQILRKNEPDISAELEKELKGAGSHEEGLAICRKFLRLAPHNTYARRRLLSYLEALEKKETLISTVFEWRREAVGDAGLLSDAASALMRLGEKAEAQRTFGELIERAPRDPWTLAFVGDRLRAEGLYDQAQAVYASLSRMLPHEAGVTLRLALAHAGAGRIDVASRLLERVAQTGGRSDDGRLSDLATVVEASLLSAARGSKDSEVEAELERRLLRAPLPEAQALVLLHAAPAAHPIRLELKREAGETLAQGAEMDARELGLVAARIERGEKGKVLLALRRDEVAGPSHPLSAKVSLLRLGPPGTLPEMETRTVQVPADGKPLELQVEEGRLL